MTVNSISVWSIALFLFSGANNVKTITAAVIPTATVRASAQEKIIADQHGMSKAGVQINSVNEVDLGTVAPSTVNFSDLAGGTELDHSFDSVIEHAQDKKMLLEEQKKKEEFERRKKEKIQDAIVEGETKMYTKLFQTEQDRKKMDADSCNPKCVKGRGICSDGVCWCLSPYTGTVCQTEIDTRPHFKYPVAVALLCAFMFLGVMIGVVISNSLNSMAGTAGAGNAKLYLQKQKKELWRAVIRA